MSGYSLSWLVRERDELIRDRRAFASALDIMKKRILESGESALSRSPLLHEWSGTRSVVGSLEMSINAIERTIEEMENLILSIQNGEIENLDGVIN
jgi:hypothetical protein